MKVDDNQRFLGHHLLQRETSQTSRLHDIRTKRGLVKRIGQAAPVAPQSINADIVNEGNATSRARCR